MRVLIPLLIVSACSSPAKPPVAPEPARPAEAAPAPPSAAVPAPVAPKTETLAADTPKTTTAGNSFIAPAGWTFAVRGDATILGAPEGDSWMAMVDVRAADADAAVKAAWAAYKGEAKWPLKVANDGPPKDGWTDRRGYLYDVPPNEKRVVQVGTQRANGVWTVVIFDASTAVVEKRLAQIQLILGRLLPKGGERESFAGKKANELDAARLAELKKFIESAQQALGVPGVAVGVIQNGKTVLAQGLGVRELGKPAKVNADTLFMIGSNTKALTTLLLGKLVDANKLTWDTKVTSVMPGFKLGDEATTNSVLIRHLICACTGLPRQDLEWIFEYKRATPAAVVAALGAMQPTSKFGEMFQYSNLLAAVAGYVAAYVANPKLELGASYDRAMQQMVFDPLGMKATTFDYARVRRGNMASPHGHSIDGKPTEFPLDMNYSVIPVRPAGAAWSSVNDMLRYVAMELAEGTLPGGKRYISKDVLLARRAPQVPIGKDATYGMGLSVDTTYGTPVVHHGGATFGYQSDMLWLPEHGVGAVILTNGTLGGVLQAVFRRKLLELLFDGRSEAEANLAATAKSQLDELAAERKQLAIPADPDEVAKLAPKYKSAELGEIAVKKTGASTVFDMGEWKAEVASRKNADGTVSFAIISPELQGLDFLVGKSAAGKPTLILRDAQHEYVFDAK
ncbi:MAG TPA: serine hydrolase domain-containing protein [Kofleriaceae bacterium]|nr:serine hydrolase domain-containing protein [Kofleriaceae bacterium]